MTTPPHEYDAFLSYSSVPDKKLVRRTKNYLAGFHRQWLLRELRLPPLKVCLDGQDFKLRSGDALVPVEKTLRDYVSQSRRLVVFCSVGAVSSKFVDHEIALFLEDHPASAILPVVTEGDPGQAPEQVFPKTLIEHGHHKAIWLDFRGDRTSLWRRGKQRFRPFGEERVKLAAELHGRAPSILPAWKRARTIQRGVATALALVGALIGAIAFIAVRHNQALRIAGDVLQEIGSGGPASISDLRARAAKAVRVYHVFETDEAYRRAAALSVRQIALPTQPLKGSHALAGSSLMTIRLAGEALEITNDPRTGIWTRVIPGAITRFDRSDDGTTIAAVESSGGLVILHQGTLSRCRGLPSDSIGQAVALEPGGQRIALLLQSGGASSLALGDPRQCATVPLTVHALWTAEETGDTDGALVSVSSRPDRVRVRLSRGGHGLIVSTAERWLLARLRDDGSPIESLNPALEEAWRKDVVELPTGRQSVVAIADEAFSADGQYAAVAAIRTDNFTDSTGPSTLLIPLSSAAPPRVINASRGNRLLAMAKGSSQLAFISSRHVRVWDWTTAAEISRADPLTGSIVSLEFAAADQLLLIAERAPQPRLHVSDVPSGKILGRLDVSEIDSMRSGGPRGHALVARFMNGDAAFYDLFAPSTVARFRKPLATGGNGTRDGVLIALQEGRLLHCATASTTCGEPSGSAATEKGPNVLATTGEASLYVRNGGSACVASSHGPEPCTPVPVGEKDISAGAVSLDGAAVAVSVRTDTGSQIEIYHRALVRWFPWPKWDYVRRSAIADPGEVKGLGFSPDAAWLASASDWRTEFVVRRFPVTAAAMVQTSNAHE